MQTVLHDIRYAVRTLRRRPAHATLAITTLALGIGATTAIFSVVDTVLLRPLPFRQAESLVAAFRTYPDWRNDDILSSSWDQISWSYPTFRAWRDEQTTFGETGAWASWFSTMRAGDRTDDILDGLGPVLLADETAARTGFGPGLPLHVFGGDGLAKTNVILGHQDVHRRDLRGGCDWRSSFLVAAARKIGGNAARTNGDSQNHNSGSVHTLLLIHDAATLPSPKPD